MAGICLLRVDVLLIRMSSALVAEVSRDRDMRRRVSCEPIVLFIVG